MNFDPNPEPDLPTDSALYIDTPDDSNRITDDDVKMFMFYKEGATWWVRRETEIASPSPVTHEQIGLMLEEHLGDLQTLHGMHGGHELMPVVRNWTARRSLSQNFIWCPYLLWSTVLTCRPGATIHQGPCVKFTNRELIIRPEAAIIKTFCPVLSMERFGLHYPRALLNFGPEHRDWESTKKYQIFFHNIFLPGVGAIVRGYLTGWRLTGAEFQRFVLDAFSEIVPGSGACYSKAINNLTRPFYHGSVAEIEFKSKIITGEIGEPLEFQITWG